MKHVDELSNRIGERNMGKYPALSESADYIRSYLLRTVLDTKDHEYTVGSQKASNIQAVLQGSVYPEEIVIVGAHYDSVYGSPGANDNATGVAAIIELARLLRDRKLDRTVRLVAFVNEEPPYFQTGEMGSLVYARRSRQAAEKIIAMISIETIGSYSEAKRSQQYPFPFSLFYPDKANFIGFVGNLTSRSLVREAIRHFREDTPFPSEGVAAPEWMTGIGWSDHWSFWQYGYPAIMVTDTALFRDKGYHTASDTAEKINYDNMARVVTGMERVIVMIANRK